MSEKVKKRLSFHKPDLQTVLVIFFGVIIFFLNFRIVGKCYNPFVFNDEAGYWTNAATMAGYDWTGMSGTLAWYSYGYSFLLVPLIKLFHDPTTLYRAALVLNIIMQTAVYFMYFYILRFLFPKLEKAKAGFICAASMLYTSYQLNAGIAFSESTLLFVTTLIVFTLIRIMKKPTFLNSGCLGALCAYLFMVHNRCIGIVASAALVMVLAAIFKKIKLRHLLIYFGVLGVGFVADRLIRGALISRLWPDGKPDGNDTGSVVSNLKTALSSFSGIKKLISILASQAFASFISAFCVSLFALWAIFRRISAASLAVIRSRQKSRKQKISKLFDGRMYLFLFIICAFVSTWIISSVFMFDYERIDHVVYTRYYDIVMGLLIMIGLCFIAEADKKDYMFMLMMPVIMLIGAQRATVLMDGVTIQVFNRVCSPALSFLFDEYGKNYYVYVAFAAAVFCVILFVMQALEKKKLGLYAASLICSFVFIYISPTAFETITINQEAYAGDRALIERVKQMPDKEIYMMTNVSTFASFLQYEMQDKKVHFVSDIDSLDENAYIFANQSDYMNLLDYELLDYSVEHILISPEKNSENVNKIPLAFMNMFDYSFYNESEDIIRNNPDNNYLCYGPYIGLGEGGYEFTLNMTVDSTSAESIGYTEVKSNSSGTVFDHAEITADMLDKNGNIRLDLNTETDAPVPDMEIIIFLYEPSKVSMQLNSIEVITEE